MYARDNVDGGIYNWGVIDRRLRRPHKVGTINHSITRSSFPLDPPARTAVNRKHQTTMPHHRRKQLQVGEKKAKFWVNGGDFQSY